MRAGVRLGLLDYGTFQVHEDGRVIPILGAVILAPGRVALVDTGFPPEYAVDPAAAAARDELDDFGRVVTLTEDNLPAAQLARLGLRLDDVTDLVVTHGDIDHVGALHSFPGATLVVDRAEVEAGAPRYNGGVRPLDWPAQTTRLVEGDEELLPGVRLLRTPGHSPGHMSLLVELAGGSMLLAGDAISRPAELETGVNGGAWEEQVARDSAARLLAIAGAEGARLVFGHDPDPQPPLRFVPHLYA